MTKENKKGKTPKQLATEKLRKRTRTLISKSASFYEDCGFHVHLLIIDEANPARQFEFKTHNELNYPPQIAVSFSASFIKMPLNIVIRNQKRLLGLSSLA